MSWFIDRVEHPALAALASILNHPAVQSNPGLKAAVIEAKAASTTIAGTVTSAAQQVSATAQAEADPILGALGTGLEAVVDAYLMNTLGPVGGGISAQVANAVIALGEVQVHNLVAALFAHARWAHADAAAQAATIPAPAPALPTTGIAYTTSIAPASPALTPS